ncbi:hypothetical protein, partial [Acidiphilium sp.]|uniref:hypothetical protein n=1 Tax=Acidiphilium sp. TaxID=527 RepID=UPI003D015CF6
EVTRDHLANREYHHLFPDALLTGPGGMPEGASYRALNCALVTWKTNRNISAKEPIAYLRERTERADLGEEMVKARLRSHLIPFDTLNVGDWKGIFDPTERASKVRGDFEAFMKDRASRMLPVIRHLCNGQGDLLSVWNPIAHTSDPGAVRADEN